MRILEDGTTIAYFDAAMNMVPDGEGVIAKIVYPDGRRVFAYPQRPEKTVKAGFDENQPRDDAGRWTDGSGLPASVSVPKDSTIDQLLRGQGNWHARVVKTNDDSYRGTTYQMAIEPRGDQPGYEVIEDSRGKRTWYDPTLMHLEKDEFNGQMRPVLNDGLKSQWYLEDQLKPEEGVLYRGMSHAEYVNAKANGYFQSNSSYNFENQQHVTLFSTEPAQAGHYANGFAPYPYKATGSAPAIVVAVKTGNQRFPEAEGGTTERAIGGKIPWSEVQAVYQGKPYQMQAGELDLTPIGRNTAPTHSEGSGSSPSSSVLWRKLDHTKSVGQINTGFVDLMFKAGFDENQPRDDQGQWTSGAGSLAAKLANGEGFTYAPVTHTFPTKGFVVSITKEYEKKFTTPPTKQQIADFMILREKSESAMIIVKALREPGAHLGAWIEDDTKIIYLDVSIVKADKDEAIALAQKHDQLAIWDLEKGEQINVLKGKRSSTAERSADPDGISDRRDSGRGVGSLAGALGIDGEQTKAVAESELSHLVRVAERLEPALRRRFLDAIRHIQNKLDLEALAHAIERGDITRAEALMKFSEWPEVFGGLAIDIRAGFIAGTSVGMQELAVVGLVMGFHNVDQYSVDYARRRLPPLVDTILRGGKEAVQEIIIAAQQGKYTAFTAAEDIKDWVGLTGIQARALSNFKLDLMARGITGAALKRRVDGHRTALIRLRAEVIARNEIMSGANHGQLQTWYEAERQGLLAKTTKKSWMVADDERLCPTCEDLGAAEPVGLHDQFVYTDDKLAFNVFDEPLYAPTQHPQCRCSMNLVMP